MSQIPEVGTRVSALIHTHEIKDNRNYIIERRRTVTVINNFVDGTGCITVLVDGEAEARRVHRLRIGEEACRCTD